MIYDFVLSIVFLVVGYMAVNAAGGPGWACIATGLIMAATVIATHR